MPIVSVCGVKSACRRTSLTEIHVAQAKFREIMSWDDWKAKARGMDPRCSQCGSAPKQAERDTILLTGLCEACTAKTDDHSGSWRELCKCS